MRTKRFPLWTLTLLSLIAIHALGVATVVAEELTVWVQSDMRRDQFREIIAWYQQDNPGVNIDLHLIPGSQAEFTQKLILGIVSGAPPDLTWLEGSTVIELAAQGLLEDVTRAADGIRFTPADTEEMTFKGRLYGIPYHTTSRGLLKRMDLFNEAGLDPQTDPGSLEELWEWNQKLTQFNADGRYTQVGFIPWTGNWGAPAWIWTFGGRLLDESGLKPTALDPKNIEAFEWIAEWAQSYGNTAPVTGGYTGFLNGTVAMVAESTSQYGRLVAEGVQLTAGRVPHPPGGQNGTWGGGHALGIPYNSRNKDEAMKLLRYFGLEDVQERRYLEFPEAFPANWNALQKIAPTLPEGYASLLDQLPEARARTPLWIEYYVSNLNPQMNNVVAGRITPQEALNAVQRVMEVRFSELFDQ